MEMVLQKREVFRSDINGLRTWAVLAVIFYHFQMPGFAGGFAGVDVFFVISGYLMGGLMFKQLEAGTFSLFAFYSARARRIVPALVVLCAVLLAVGWFVLVSNDYKRLATHSAYSISFLSNFEYWLEAGYFDQESHEKWLLHTWSLSVEWQFYMLLPLFMWGMWRHTPGIEAQRRLLAGGTLLSLVACIAVTPSDPSAAFFLLHTRAWEMLAGAMLYVWTPLLSLGERQRRWMEVAGLAMIAISVAVFDSSSAWPGWRSVVPVAGAVLVLAANRSSIWTGNAVAQWIGNRSYSLYLWHWPVFVALTYFLLDGWLISAAGIGASFLLGHLSYIWIEVPARRWLSRGSATIAGGRCCRVSAGRGAGRGGVADERDTWPFRFRSQRRSKGSRQFQSAPQRMPR